MRKGVERPEYEADVTEGVLIDPVVRPSYYKRNGDMVFESDECPRCRSRDIGKNGTVRRSAPSPENPERKAVVQKHKCKICGGFFDADTGGLFEKHDEYPLYVILMAILLFSMNLTERLISVFLSTVFGMYIDHSTVSTWLKPHAKGPIIYDFTKYLDGSPSDVAVDAQCIALNGVQSTLGIVNSLDHNAPLVMIWTSARRILTKPWTYLRAKGASARNETKSFAKRLIRTLIKLKGLKSVLMDGSQAFFAAVRSLLPAVGIRRCFFHVLASVNKLERTFRDRKGFSSLPACLLICSSTVKQILREHLNLDPLAELERLHSYLSNFKAVGRVKSGFIRPLCGILRKMIRNPGLYFSYRRAAGRCCTTGSCEATFRAFDPRGKKWQRHSYRELYFRAHFYAFRRWSVAIGGIPPGIEKEMDRFYRRLGFPDSWTARLRRGFRLNDDKYRALSRNSD